MEVKNLTSQCESLSSIKDNQIQDLMDSIENKLSIIICEDLPEQSYPQKTTKCNNKKMHLKQLSTSNYQNDNSMRQSRVLTRINQMQEYYMKQIRQLNYKIVYLQNQNEKISQQCSSLKIANQKLELLVIEFQSNLKGKLNKNLQQIKCQLIKKFRNQADEEHQRYQQNLQIINQELKIQKKRRKTIQQELDLLKSEKQTLNLLYKQLLEDHRRLIQVDINHLQLNKSKNKEEDFMIINSKKNQSSKKKNQTTKNLNRQELIPMLAKSIEELKQKLKIKP